MIQSEKEARESLLKGVNILANTVRKTLGPNGRTVILHTPDGKAYTTKDGVSVARKILDNDMMVDAGIQLIREATAKTADVAGDGTTTSTILAQSLINQGITQINNGQLPLNLKVGMEEALKDFLNALPIYSEPVEFEREALANVATISANNDKELGETVADAFMMAGKDGLVLFDTSDNGYTYIETINGMQIDSILLSPGFINNQRAQTAEYENRDKEKNVVVVLIDNIVKNIQEMAQNGLNFAIQSQAPIVIIAHDFTPAMIKEIMQNNLRGNTQILPLKAEGFGIGKTECLRNVAAITGAKIFDNTANVRREGFGYAKKVITSKFNTTIVKSDAIADTPLLERADVLKQRISEAVGEDKKQLEKKLAKLIGKMAIIHVGGITEAVAKEKYDRVEDAVYATKAAIEEGVSMGGGVTYLYMAYDMQRRLDTNNPYAVGYSIVLEALRAPFKQLCENSEMSFESLISVILNETDDRMGFDFLKGLYCDPYEKGIVDPTKVLRVALENAVSIATLMLTTSSIVTSE